MSSLTPSSCPYQRQIQVIALNATLVFDPHNISNHKLCPTGLTKRCLWNYLQSSTQCCQPPIFSPDICAKSETNPKCLRKSLHQTNPKRRVFATKPVLRQKRVFSTKPFSRQKRVFVELQLGHVIIGMIPATPSMHENHAFDHKKIVNIVWKAHLFRHARQKERQKSWMNV